MRVPHLPLLPRALLSRGRLFSTSIPRQVLLKDKTILLTGSSSGITASLSSLLASPSLNNRLLLADIRLPPTTLANATFIKTDVTDLPSLHSIFASHSPDVVIVGAGAYEPSLPAHHRFWSSPPEPTPYYQLKLNLEHPIHLTRLALHSLLSRRAPGAVLIISSTSGQTSRLAAPLYTASKHALNGFVRSVGGAGGLLEKKYGIRVVAVAPGIVRTPLWTGRERMVREGEGDRWIEANEVARACVDVLEDVDRWSGGDVVEVGKGALRLVRELNDPGPVGEGHTLKGGGEVDREVEGWLEETYGKSGV